MVSWENILQSSVCLLSVLAGHKALTRGLSHAGHAVLSSYMLVHHVRVFIYARWSHRSFCVYAFFGVPLLRMSEKHSLQCVLQFRNENMIMDRMTKLCWSQAVRPDVA